MRLDSDQRSCRRQGWRVILGGLKEVAARWCGLTFGTVGEALGYVPLSKVLPSAKSSSEIYETIKTVEGVPLSPQQFVFSPEKSLLILPASRNPGKNASGLRSSGHSMSVNNNPPSTVAFLAIRDNHLSRQSQEFEVSGLQV